MGAGAGRIGSWVESMRASSVSSARPLSRTRISPCCTYSGGASAAPGPGELPATALRRVLEIPGAHQAPACYDALSARLVERAEFRACFTSVRVLFDNAKWAYLGGFSEEKQRTKYNNMESDAVDFFGECMNSPQNGRTPLANEIYEQMVAEKERELEEGEAQKSPSKLNRPHLKKTKVCSARPKRK
ncbi:hypothetical protein Zm00014a_036897 [Zea mays]|uniref:Uncharacterized protein n=1 Tax=Zea mays TaxID=4577 RepID=A0A3L6G506_MAIZE|nr:hypothetical protein Zm00014a_036897 [Zea mays]